MYENLTHELTPEERSRGGQNSVESRRRKKTASEVAQMILSGSLRASDLAEGITIDDMSIISGVVAMLARKSLDGNVKATELLLTLAGEYTPKASIKANVVRDDDESIRKMDEYFKRRKAQADSMTE